MTARNYASMNDFLNCNYYFESYNSEYAIFDESDSLAKQCLKQKQNCKKRIAQRGRQIETMK